MEGEDWESVKGYEGLYEVSNFGRVLSVSRHITNSFGHIYWLEGRFLKQMTDPNGYAYVHLAMGGRASKHRVHRLVAEHFIPNDKQAPLVLHGAGGKTDNRISNLSWGTNSENMMDKARDGTDARHSQTHCLRGHEYNSNNLLAHNGKRACRSCVRAREYVRKNGGDLKDRSDWYYEKIMKEVKV